MALDLSKMTKSEKLRMIDLIEEKERRIREKKEAYSPNDGQLLVHSNRKKIRCVWAGNGSGKTALGVNEALWIAQGYNPVLKEFTKVPARVAVVLDMPDKVDQVFMPELRKWANIPETWLRKHGRPYVVEIQFPNGSQILFFFHEQSLLLFESIEVDMAIYDEPPPKHCFIGLLRGGRKKDREAKYLLIGTPLSCAWLREDLYEPWTKGERPDMDCFRYDTSVNENNLSKNYKEDFGRYLSAKERRVRFSGEFFDLEGLALAHLWRRDRHVITRDQFDELWEGNSGPCVVALDFHPEKAHVACLIGCDRNDNLYYIKEYASREEPKVFARSLKEWYAGYRLVDIICDCLGQTALTGGDGNKSFMQVLREEGVPVRATSFMDKDEDSWIARVQNNLYVPPLPAVPKLRVVDGNRGIIGDIESVQWLKVKHEDLYKPKLDMKHKDYLSTVKYAIAAHLSYSKPSTAVYRHEPVTSYGQKPAGGMLGRQFFRMRKLNRGRRTAR